MFNKRFTQQNFMQWQNHEHNVVRTDRIENIKDTVSLVRGESQK